MGTVQIEPPMKRFVWVLVVFQAFLTMFQETERGREGKGRDKGFSDVRSQSLSITVLVPQDPGLGFFGNKTQSKIRKEKRVILLPSCFYNLHFSSEEARGRYRRKDENSEEDKILQNWLLNCYYNLHLSSEVARGSFRGAANWKLSN